MPDWESRDASRSESRQVDMPLFPRPVLARQFASNTRMISPRFSYNRLGDGPVSLIHPWVLQEFPDSE
jgi:hypothetical protein